MKVFVVDKNNNPLMPTHPAKARILLKNGKATVKRVEPFVIKLNYTIDNPKTQNVKVGIDDGARNAGLAVVVEKSKKDDEVVFKGQIDLNNMIKDKMEERSNYRRCRRTRLRYRKPRFNNRKRNKCVVCGGNTQSGKNTCRLHKVTDKQNKLKNTYWLPPSLKARKDCIVRVLNQLNKWIPINNIIIETGRFDIQKLVNPDLSGAGYQQGAKYGRDSVKSALIYEYGKEVRDENNKIKKIARCCYCGKEGVPLEIEHIKPRGQGGTDAWHNLTLACKKCNKEKGNRTPQQANMKLIVKPSKFHLSKTLKYAAQLQQGKNYLRQAIKDAVNIFPSYTYGQFTSWQRKRFNIPKTHMNDAIVIAITNYDTENKPRLPVVNCDEYYIKPIGTKSRSLFTATCYSPKDYCYNNEGKRKRINSINAAVLTNNNKTIRALKEINKACVLLEKNNKIVPKAIRMIEDIPDNAIMVVEKGDTVECNVGKKKLRGIVSACMSNGNIKINVQGKQQSASLKKTRLIYKKQNIIFQKIHKTTK
ncbi:MAG: hypothetical protein GX947_04900 [Tissierellia bacterium]|nr:hypothetical protein [Tissierellia bacterium]